MPTRNELTQLQSLPLELKIMRTQQRIREWVQYYGVDGVYVSFSGGKDSTVLLDMVRKLYPTVKAVFINTGLEYPENQQFVKSFDNVEILRPAMRFDEVIKTYGYPVIGKEVSECVYQGRMALTGNRYPYRLQKLFGTAKDKNGNESKYNKTKYAPLLFTDFKISHMCCNVMKKKPAHEYSKITGKMPMTAQMAEESQLREQQWLRNGCNGFDMKSPISNPMSFWTEQDVLQYIKQNNLPISKVYGEVVVKDDGGYQYGATLCDCGKLCTTDAKRTGCIFCMYSAHCKGDERFLLLKKIHPRQYEYCMGGGAYDTDGFWKPTKDGLGMKHVIDELNKIYGDGFIKY